MAALRRADLPYPIQRVALPYPIQRVALRRFSPRVGDREAAVGSGAGKRGSVRHPAGWWPAGPGQRCPPRCQSAHRNHDPTCRRFPDATSQDAHAGSCAAPWRRCSKASAEGAAGTRGSKQRPPAGRGCAPAASPSSDSAVSLRTDCRSSFRKSGMARHAQAIDGVGWAPLGIRGSKQRPPAGHGCAPAAVSVRSRCSAWSGSGGGAAHAMTAGNHPGSPAPGIKAVVAIG
jgi:hypothetical protein